MLGINCYFGRLRVIFDSLLCALSMCSLDRLTIVPLHPGKELRARKSQGARDQGARDDEPKCHPVLAQLQRKTPPTCGDPFAAGLCKTGKVVLDLEIPSHSRPTSVKKQKIKRKIAKWQAVLIVKKLRGIRRLKSKYSLGINPDQTEKQHSSLKYSH